MRQPTRPSAALRLAIAVDAFEAQRDGELSVRAGDRVRLLCEGRLQPSGWTHAVSDRSKLAGLVPTNRLALASEVVATAAFEAASAEELSVKQDERCLLLPSGPSQGWCAVTRADGSESGLVPKSFLRLE